MTDLADSRADRAKRRSGYALRPAASLTLACLLIALFGVALIALTPVAANKAFISMEGLYLLGFGPRTAAAARDLSIKLYPGLAPQAEKFKPATLSANCRL